MTTPSPEESTNKDYNSEIKNVVNAIDNSKEVVTENDNTDEQILSASIGQKAYLDRYTGDTSLKKYLTFFVMCFTSVWSIAILGLLYLTAWGKFHISDPILIALLTETLATVLGLPFVVTYHFFPKQK